MCCMAKISSGRTLAVLVCIDVPPSVPEGQEVAAFMPAISVTVTAAPQLKAVTAKVVRDDPQTLARQFAGPQLMT